MVSEEFQINSLLHILVTGSRFFQLMISIPAGVKCWLHQTSIVGPILFLIYINDLNVAVKYSEVQQFAYDIDLLNFNGCVKSINRQVNCDLKHFPTCWQH